MKSRTFPIVGNAHAQLRGTMFGTCHVRNKIRPEGTISRDVMPYSFGTPRLVSSRAVVIPQTLSDQRGQSKATLRQVLETAQQIGAEETEEVHKNVQERRSLLERPARVIEAHEE